MRLGSPIYFPRRSVKFAFPVCPKAPAPLVLLKANCLVTAFFASLRIKDTFQLTVTLRGVFNFRDHRSCQKCSIDNFKKIFAGPEIIKNLKVQFSSARRDESNDGSNF